MKYFALLIYFLKFLLLAQSLKSCKLCSNVQKSSSLVDAVSKFVSTTFMNHASSANIVSSESLSTLDVKNDLMSKLYESSLVLRHLSFKTLSQALERQQRFIIILIKTVEDFKQFYIRLSRKLFSFKGFYIVVMINGKISQIQEIFELMWKLQIINVSIMSEIGNGAILVQTFKPFRKGNCNDTSPTDINVFKDGRFVNGSDNLFPEKIKNLQKCQIRVAISENSKPSVFVEKLANKSNDYSGVSVELINTLARYFNFKIYYDIVPDEGFIFDNGTAEGPLKVLYENKADLAIATWWLKVNRLKFFDASISYISDHLIFIIPPGRELTPFEKLVYPFEFSAWIIIIVYYHVGLLTIFIVKRLSKTAQNFVFGYGVEDPYMNMFIAFVGATQKITPNKNFARFLLAMFLMYSLVIRSLYQGSYVELMQSNKRHQEVKSVDEMVQMDFKFHVTPGNIDMFSGVEAVKKRLKL